ncbi:hypothetical protein AQ610_29525 [Burkholderia humptydooensis]|uniref:Uncharacterized protein n=1 Tax=Burkholderia humptydooensis MSMB43 TaxID=441157 RepID=A0ABN0G127_9BURK|nr:hypothetical protein AQ610_29525 [Burkholderia humptydooensis]EIP85924.1 hypothetical protein A33K_17014 [Burkholderia humptydooensis MSMB43]
MPVVEQRVAPMPTSRRMLPNPRGRFRARHAKRAQRAHAVHCRHTGALPHIASSSLVDYWPVK